VDTLPAYFPQKVKSDISLLVIIGRLRSAYSTSPFDKGVIVALPAPIMSALDPFVNYRAHLGVLCGESPAGWFSLLLWLIVVICILVVILL
jgi:hypothetical protein